VLCEIIQAVKINKNFFYHRASWLKKPVLSNRYRSWLTESNSLTARLQHSYADFFVHPVSINIKKPVFEEAVLLKVSYHVGVQIREVLLFGNKTPLVFAHSVLPRKSLNNAWRELGKLGSKPLGAVLFANPNVKRTPLTYKKLSTNHALYKAAVNHLSVKPAFLWARRSIFSLNCASIMVTEIFLPGLIKP
jgi:chorismate--pyruvate lyase